MVSLERLGMMGGVSGRVLAESETRVPPSRPAGGVMLGGVGEPAAGALVGAEMKGPPTPACARTGPGVTEDGAGEALAEGEGVAAGAGVGCA